jgi:hypothetical protein
MFKKLAAALVGVSLIAALTVAGAGSAGAAEGGGTVSVVQARPGTTGG